MRQLPRSCTQVRALDRERPRRLLLTSVVLVVLTATATDTGAEERDQPTSPSPAIERLLSRPGVMGPVEAAAALGGLRPRPAAAPPARRLPHLPAHLARPVGLLVDAVTSAEAAAAGSVPAARGHRVQPSDLAAVAQAIARWRPGRQLPKIHPQLPRRVDQGAQVTALRLLASAVDVALPDLRRLAGPSRGAAVVGCDVVDRLPLLCVGSSADNVYTADAAVLVDLGGDDVHRHSAGGAFPLANGLAVALTVDVAGNDHYPDLPAEEDELPVGLGSGVLGGVGLLVDDAGDDRYERAGQGLGLAGAGALVDARGNDRYRYGQKFVALGGGVALSGVGVLADHDGDDRYTAAARSVLRAGRPTGAAVFALGTAVGGVAVQWDGGGRDVASLEATALRDTQVGVLGFGVAALRSAGLSAWGGGATRRSVLAASAGSSRDTSAAVLVAGSALVGNAAMRDAGGDDSTRITVRVQPVGGVAAGATAVALGVGLLGTGSVEDSGGDDAYAVTLDAAPPATHPPGRVIGASVLSHAVGLGYASQGRLVDRAGDDVYTVDARAPGGVNGPSAPLSVLAQGFAAGGGSGALRDLAGSDRYTVHARSIGIRHRPFVRAQGAGFLGLGALNDVDGGPTDGFVLHPAEPLCVGERGSSYWSDCTGGVGSAS